jgi:hypothetical protein
MQDNTKTQILKSDFLSSKDAIQEIKSLNEKFRAKYKRAPKIDLVYSLSGDKKNPIHAVAIWHDESNQKEIELIKNLT